jgi:hypothetical protein
MTAPRGEHEPYHCGDPDCPPGYHRGEYVYNMDEGDPEMEAWFDDLDARRAAQGTAEEQAQGLAPKPS